MPLQDPGDGFPVGLRLCDAPRIRSSLLAVPGMRGVWGPGVAGWTNDLTPGADEIQLHGGATNTNDGYTSFDGESGFAATESQAELMNGFAGSLGSPTWNGSGITLFFMLRIQPGDLENRTWVHWKNPDDYCRWMMRVTGDSRLQFWNAYASDGAAEYLDPVSPGTQAAPRRTDRFYTIMDVDLCDYLGGKRLDDGEWHLVAFSRGTTGTYSEKKQLVIDGELVYFSGTGNGINGFTDFTCEVTFGKTRPTTLASDAGLEWRNFKGDSAAFAVANRWVPIEDVLSVFAG